MKQYPSPTFSTTRPVFDMVPVMLENQQEDTLLAQTKLTPANPTSNDQPIKNQALFEKTVQEALNALPRYVLNPQQAQENTILHEKVEKDLKKTARYLVYAWMLLSASSIVTMPFVMESLSQGWAAGFLLTLAWCLPLSLLGSGVASLIKRKIKNKPASTQSHEENTKRTDLLYRLAQITNNTQTKKRLAQLSDFTQSNRVLDPFWEQLYDKTTPFREEYNNLLREKEKAYCQKVLQELKE